MTIEIFPPGRMIEGQYGGFFFIPGKNGYDSERSLVFPHELDFEFFDHGRSLWATHGS
jgi:hypothetical protein